MAEELDSLTLSTGAQLLIYDLANGCIVSRTGRGAPSIVIPRPDGPIPKTKGQISDSVIQKLLDHGLVHLFGETSPQPCKLTLMGEAYYERFLMRARH